MIAKTVFATLQLQNQQQVNTRKFLVNSSREIPKSSIFGGIFDMFQTIGISAAVAKPYIISEIKVLEWEKLKNIPVGIYLLKVNNRNTNTRCEICSKLTIKTPERHHWRRSGDFIVNFEHLLISHLVLMFLLLTLNISLLAGSFQQCCN